MPVQTRLARVGLAEQTGEGSPASGADYTIGVTEGQVHRVEVTEEALATTWETRVHSARERQGAVPGAEFTTIAMPKSIGRILKGLLGAVSTSGTSAPFTHDFTVADSLPWLTLFTRFGAEYYEIDDAKLSQVEFSWDQTGALRAAVTAMGKTITFLDTSAFTTGTEERPTDGYFRGVGGTFDVDGAGARVTSGTITISNEVESIIASNSITPDSVFESRAAIELSLTTVPDNLDDWRKFLTGSASGTSIAADPYTGALDLEFLASDDANHSLRFHTSSDVAFLADMPGADAEGGPAELTIEGFVLGATNSDAITVTLVNAESAYT